MIPLILHIPHASKVIPREWKHQFCLSAEELEKELLTMTDHFTDELFDFEDALQVKANVSRLILDVERFEDDKLEHMSKIGMGVIYTKTSQLTALRNSVRHEERVSMIEKYYHAHHQQLEQICHTSLEQHGQCLIIDCHSFPTHTLPYELKIHGTLSRPEICIGTDSYHTTHELEESCAQAFQKLGYEVSINAPFAGALVPMAYYRKNANVQSLMIELRRDLYMDETTGERNNRFEQLQRDIGQVLQNLHQPLGATPERN